MADLIRRRWVYEVVYAGLVVGAAALVLSPVLRRSGWPLTEASTAPLILVQMYAAHFRHLDFLPVWSSTDGIGLGSPILLYYHRAFFWIAGFIYVLVGSDLKFAVVATIAIFLVVGAYGMRLALSVITDSRLLCTVGSLGFLFTNYVFNNWFDPRGDLAEFSALMVVPWLLYWCLNLVKHRRVSFLLIPIMVLLVNAHSAIALISLLVLATSLVTFVAFAGFKGLRAVAARLAISIGGATLILAPILVAELRFSHYYDPQNKNTVGGASVSRQFVSVWSYFYEHTRWLAPGNAFVQIDFAIWVPIVAALVGGVAYWVLTGRRALPGGLRMPVLVFLLASLAVYFFMALRFSLWVYRILAPLQVIAFPWRMLAFITPIGVLLVALIADRAMRWYPIKALWRVLAGVWLATLIVLSPITSGITESYGYLAAPGQFPYLDLFAAPTRVNYQRFNGFFLGGGSGALYGVFLPKVYDREGNELADDDHLYEKLHSHDEGAASLSQVPCTVAGPAHAPFETLELTFSVSCAGATRLALPVSINAFSKVFVRNAAGQLHQIPYAHIPTDPRMIIHVAGPGSETVVVHLPTLWGTLF